MGINTISGRISDCNMYHWGIYLQCEGRRDCFISQDSNGKQDVLQPRVVKAGKGTGKKTFTINQSVKESFRTDICRMHHHQPWEKAERQNGWINFLGQQCLSCSIFPALESVICSRAAVSSALEQQPGQNSGSGWLSYVHIPCQAFSLLLAPECLSPEAFATIWQLFCSLIP